MWARPPTGCARSAGTCSDTGRRSASPVAAPAAGSRSPRRTSRPGLRLRWHRPAPLPGLFRSVLIHVRGRLRGLQRAAARAGAARDAHPEGTARSVGAVRARPIPRRPARPAHDQPVPDHAAGRAGAPGCRSGRLRAAEANGRQGEHPLLRRRVGDAGALPHPGASRGAYTVARATTSTMLRTATSAFSATSSASRCSVLTWRLADAGRRGDRRSRTSARRRWESSRSCDRLRAGHRRPDPDSLQLRHPDRR